MRVVGDDRSLTSSGAAARAATGAGALREGKHGRKRRTRTRLIFVPRDSQCCASSSFFHLICCTIRAAYDHEKLATTYKSQKRGEMEKEGYRILRNFGDQWSDLLVAQCLYAHSSLPIPCIKFSDGSMFQKFTLY